MSVLIVFGYGPGVSHATATRFAREGYSIALVGRNEGRLTDGVARLRSEGFAAKAFHCDASDPERIRQTVASVHDELGTVSAILWTAFRNGKVKDVLATRPEDIERVFDIGVTGLLACVQAALDDLRSARGAAVLVANGSVGDNTSLADGFAARLGIDGVALENAAKSKLVGILAERLRELDIYVGEITIAGSVKGTATAMATAIEPTAIADAFWSMSQARDTTRVRVTEAGLA